MYMIRAAAALLLLLSLSGCGGRLLEPAKEASLSVAALFQAESGESLQGGAARFSAGERSVSCQLDSSGEAKVSGLPRSGELRLTLCDQQQRLQGAMTLSLSEGAVIDATTGKDGVGHITVRSDTEEVALVFVLAEDGALRCTLRLEGTGPARTDILQKGA